MIHGVFFGRPVVDGTVRVLPACIQGLDRTRGQFTTFVSGWCCGAAVLGGALVADGAQLVTKLLGEEVHVPDSRCAVDLGLDRVGPGQGDRVLGGVPLVGEYDRIHAGGAITGEVTGLEVLPDLLSALDHADPVGHEREEEPERLVGTESVARLLETGLAAVDHVLAGPVVPELSCCGQGPHLRVGEAQRVVDLVVAILEQKVEPTTVAGERSRVPSTQMSCGMH